MKAVVSLCVMIFMHCVADYYLQGILASMKQKEWWAKQFPNHSEFSRSVYTKDYIAALMAHSYEWSFLILSPMLYYCICNSDNIPALIFYLIALISEMLIHVGIDNDKANEKKLNLIQDQFLHLFQILTIWLAWLLVIGF